MTPQWRKRTDINLRIQAVVDGELITLELENVDALLQFNESATSRGGNRHVENQSFEVLVMHLDYTSAKPLRDRVIDFGKKIGGR